MLIPNTSLDIHHEIFLQLLGGRLHLAPLNAPQRILDIGTGTGLWAIDVADTYVHHHQIFTSDGQDTQIPLRRGYRH